MAGLGGDSDSERHGHDVLDHHGRVFSKIEKRNATPCGEAECRRSSIKLWSNGMKESILDE